MPKETPEETPQEIAERILAPRLNVLTEEEKSALIKSIIRMILEIGEKAA